MKIRKTLLLSLFFTMMSVQAGESMAQTGIFFDEFGAGYKGPALGQAFTAMADDSSAAYYNPAGLTQLKQIFTITMGYNYFKPGLWARYPDYPELNLSEQPSSRGFYLGIGSNLDFKKTIEVFPWFKRFAFAMILWAPVPEFIQYHVGPSALRPHFLRHDDRFQGLSIAASMSIEITSWLSAGAGILPSLETRAEEIAAYAVNKRDEFGVDDPTNGLRLSIEQDAKGYLIPIAGLLFKLPVNRFQDAVTVGLSFRGTNISHHGRGRIIKRFSITTGDGEPIAGVRIPDTYNIQLVTYVPWQLTTGITLRPIPGLAVTYDMTFKKYSSYRTYMGLTPEPTFMDTYTHRLGTEYVFYPGFSKVFIRRIGKIAFRIGYYFEPTPTATFEPSPNIPNTNAYDSDQNVITGGMTFTLKGNKGEEHEFQVIYQYHHFRQCSRYAYLDPVYAHVFGLNRNGYLELKTGGRAYGFGASYTLRF